MAKKKITLEEAFAVFEQHGLKVEVTAAVDTTTPDPSAPQLADFLDTKQQMDYTQYPPVPKIISTKKTQITLHAKHSVGSGGYMVKGDDGQMHAEQQGVESYGPGVCTVPTELVQHLLHQDSMAKQADSNFLDRTFRSYIVVPRRSATGTVNKAICVSDEQSFDMSSFLGGIADGNVHFIR